MGQTPHQSVESQLGAFPTGAAVGGDGRAMDPPTQGAVQGVDLCVEAQIALGVMQGVDRWATAWPLQNVVVTLCPDSDSILSTSILYYLYIM